MSQVRLSNDLALLGDKVLSAFHKASKQFIRLRDSRNTPLPYETACQTEGQRFQLWCINLGLFQPSHRSLDYRLRLNESVRSLVAALLNDLCLALDDLNSELSRGIDDDTKPHTTSIYAAAKEDIDARLSPHDKQDQASGSSSTEADEEDLMKLYLEDVVDINDELMKVAMQIRSPNLRKLHKNFQRRGGDCDEEHGYTKILQSFRKKGIKQGILSARRHAQFLNQTDLCLELRDSDEFLVDRFSKANDHRRQQFEYWKTNRLQSVRSTTVAAAKTDVENSVAKPVTQSLLTPMTEVTLVKSAPATMSMPSVSLLAPEFEVRSVRSAKTHQSRGLTVHEPSGNLIVWPEVPSTVHIGKEFECPLCYFLCPREQGSGEAWRVHLKHDLSPYSCTYPDCAQPDALYESRDQWIQHEQWNHVCIWRCPKDNAEFDDVPSYREHVGSQHPTDMDQLLTEGVLATQRFLVEQQSRCCPICDVDLNGSQEIYDHIGSHLESVALLAIPSLRDPDSESTSDGATSEAAREDAEGSRKNDFDKTVPLIFPENEQTDTYSDKGQKSSRLDFGSQLAKLPEQTRDHFSWLEDVTPDQIQEPLSEYDNRVERLDTLRKPLPAKLPCYMVPCTRDENFYGRDDILQALTSILLPSNAGYSSDSKSVKSAYLIGLGGIGKSSIAREFALTRRNSFDAIFWITADGVAKLERGFVEIATILGLSNSAEFSNPVILREIAKGWLEHTRIGFGQDENSNVDRNASWLIIFDDVDQPEILKNYWPVSSTGSILLTTRNSGLESVLNHPMTRIEVEPFNDQESAILLQRLSGNTDENGAQELAHKLGGHPLAIAQTANSIRLTKATFAEYHEISGYQRDITELQVLDTLHPAALALLNVCAVLDSDCIQERIFTESIPRQDILSGLLTSKKSYHGVLKATSRTSLMKRQGEGNLSIHRLVGNLVWSNLDSRSRLAVLSAAIVLLNKVWGPSLTGQRHVLTAHEKHAELVPHIYKVQDIIEEMDSSLDVSTNNRFTRLLVEAGWCQHEGSGDPAADKILNLTTRIDHEEDPQLCFDMYHLLSDIASDTNMASETLQYAVGMDVNSTKCSQSMLRQAIAHNQLGVAAVLTKNYDTAIKHFVDSINRYRDVPEYWDGMDEDPRVNLGFVHWILGELKKANQILEDCLEARERRFGALDQESYHIGRVLHALGNVRFDQGRLEESKELHENALTQYDWALGTGHHKTADLCHKVAQHCIRRHEYVRAVKQLRYALRMYQFDREVRAPEIARTTFLFAIVMGKLGKRAVAVKFAQQARKMRNEILGVVEKTLEKKLTEKDFDELVSLFSR